MPIARPRDLDTPARQRLEEGLWTEVGPDGLSVQSLSSDVMHEIAPADLDQDTIKRAAGRPLYVLLGRDPKATIARRVERRFKEAETDGERRLLALAALAGPVANAIVHSLPGADISVSRRDKVLGGSEQQDLRKVLPPLQPELLADAVLLEWLADQDELQVERMLEVALDGNPVAVEARLGSLWSGLPLKPAERRHLRGLQALFDQRCPNRITEIYDEASSLANALAAEVDLSADTAVAKQWEASARRLELIADRRPFDPAIRLRGAMGAVDAILHYGVAGRFDDLERWGDRLQAVAAAFPADPEIRLREARGAGNAITRYGVAGQSVARRRWFLVLATVARQFPFDLRIQHIAGEFNVTSADQQTAGRPYGEPEDGLPMD